MSKIPGGHAQPTLPQPAAQQRQPREPTSVAPRLEATLVIWADRGHEVHGYAPGVWGSMEEHKSPDNNVAKAHFPEPFNMLSSRAHAAVRRASPQYNC